MSNLCTSVFELSAGVLQKAESCPLNGRLSLSKDMGSSFLSVAKRKQRKKTLLYQKPLASIQQFNPDDFSVEKLLGTYGFMNISSYTSSQFGGIANTGTIENIAAGFDKRDVMKMGNQEIGQGNVEIRLYAGKISRGPRMGTRVIMKAYPGRSIGGSEADIMAENELAAYATLQDSSDEPSDEDLCPNLTVLLGGFETRTGEQWLVFRDDGRYTAVDYAKLASVATSEQKAVGEWDFWDRYDKRRPIQRRQKFLLKLFRGTFSGLSYMHSKGQLHQSLGPASVVLNLLDERDSTFLVPRLKDLSFAVDISDSTLFTLGGANEESNLSEGLWRRARSAGARTPFERKAFGIADDIYAGGLFMASIVFISLSEPGSIDGPTLQRLLENTFRLDLNSAREYCIADDRWVEAVQFLDLDEGAGWELLQAMLNPDYRQRPIAEAVAYHRWMTMF